MRTLSKCPVGKEVIVCVSVGDGNVFFIVATKTHKDVDQSFNYYSPKHGEEFELDSVVSWHNLP